ncbi:hypothetical protein [Novipirellula sp.]
MHLGFSPEVSAFHHVATVGGYAMAVCFAWVGEESSLELGDKPP